MPHCTINFVWYLGKFIIGFTGLMFLYVGFLRENEKSCVCGARMRESLRPKSEKLPNRCTCAEGMQNKQYPCGCKKPMQPIKDDNMVPPDANEHVKRKCMRSRYFTRRNSY